MAELFNRRFVSLLTIVLFSSAMMAPLSALLPAYVEKELSLPPRFTGALDATPMIIAMVLFLIGGALTDMFGYKRTLLIGLAGMGVSGAVFLLVSLPLLFTAFVLIGIGWVLQTAGSQSYLLSVTAASRMGMGGALFFIAFTAGSSLGSVIIGPVAEYWGYSVMGYIMISGMAVVILLGLVLLPEVAPPAGAHQRSLRTSFAGYVNLWIRPQVRWLLAVRFLPTCAWGAATVAYPYLIFVATGTERQPAYYTATSLAVSACAQILTGRTCDRIGVRWPVRIAPIAMLISCLLTAIWADSLWALWVFGIALSASAWSLSTTMPVLMNSMAAGQERGKIVGATHLAWALGMGAGKFAAGWLLEIDPSACYIAGSALCAATAVWAWRDVSGPPSLTPQG